MKKIILVIISIIIISQLVNSQKIEYLNNGFVLKSYNNQKTLTTCLECHIQITNSIKGIDYNIGETKKSVVNFVKPKLGFDVKISDLNSISLNNLNLRLIEGKVQNINQFNYSLNNNHIDYFRQSYWEGCIFSNNKIKCPIGNRYVFFEFTNTLNQGINLTYEQNNLFYNGDLSLIDPIYYLDNNSAIADNSLVSGDPTGTYDLDNIVNCTDNYQDTHGIIKINLTTIPQNIQIIDANLNLFIVSNALDAGEGFLLDPYWVNNTFRWTEAAIDWNLRPSEKNITLMDNNSLFISSGLTGWIHLNITHTINYSYFFQYSNISLYLRPYNQSSPTTVLNTDAISLNSRSDTPITQRWHLNITYIDLNSETEPKYFDFRANATTSLFKIFSNTPFWALNGANISGMCYLGDNTVNITNSGEVKARDLFLSDLNQTDTSPHYLCIDSTKSHQIYASVNPCR